jgi:hypothetical protein
MSALVRHIGRISLREASGNYDILSAQGGWTRRRLELRVAGDSLRPSLMRQLLVAAAVVLAAVTWRVAARKE